MIGDSDMGTGEVMGHRGSCVPSFSLCTHIRAIYHSVRIEFSISCGGEQTHRELPSPRDHPATPLLAPQPPATTLFFFLGNLFLFLFNYGVFFCFLGGYSYSHALLCG